MSVVVLGAQLSDGRRVDLRCDGATIAELVAEGSPRPRVIATGGLATLLANESSLIEAVDELLTLEGLRLIHLRNV